MIINLGPGVSPLLQKKKSRKAELPAKKKDSKKAAGETLVKRNWERLSLSQKIANLDPSRSGVISAGSGSKAAPIPLPKHEQLPSVDPAIVSEKIERPESVAHGCLNMGIVSPDLNMLGGLHRYKPLEVIPIFDAALGEKSIKTNEKGTAGKGVVEGPGWLGLSRDVLVRFWISIRLVYRRTLIRLGSGCLLSSIAAELGWLRGEPGCS